MTTYENQIFGKIKDGFAESDFYCAVGQHKKANGKKEGAAR